MEKAGEEKYDVVVSRIVPPNLDKGRVVRWKVSVRVVLRFDLVPPGRVEKDVHKGRLIIVGSPPLSSSRAHARLCHLERFPRSRSSLSPPRQNHPVKWSLLLWLLLLQG